MPKLNARMGLNGCRKIGWIRICFAATNIIDRILLGLDLDFFFSPTRGILPIDGEERGLFGSCSLLRGLGAEDDSYLWFMYWAGVMNATLLLLGVAPRLNAIALYCNTCSFHNMNWILCDGYRTGLCPLVRIFSFVFFFLPLHHITIWDKFGFHCLKYHKSEDCSWSMWPVWLLQWQSVLVMAGAMVGKFDGDFWLQGSAMYYVSSCTDEGVGIFNPDILYNRVLPSKILTWSALVIEVISPFTIWFEKTRIPTLTIVVLIFFGMDVTMNMGTFEVYNIIGWSFFLIRSESFKKNDSKKADISPRKGIPALILRIVGYSWFVIHLVSIFSMAFPLETALGISPAWLRKLATPVEEVRWQIRDRLEPIMDGALDIGQDEWTLFSGGYNGATAKMAIEATLTDGSTREWRTINWNMLPKWKRKRYYNFLNYLKHVSDNSEAEEEQQWFLEKIAEGVLFPMGLSIELLILYTYEEEPPPYPKHLGWFDELKTEELISGRSYEQLYFEYTDEEIDELIGRKMEDHSWFYDLFERVWDDGECCI